MPRAEVLYYIAISLSLLNYSFIIYIFYVDATTIISCYRSTALKAMKIVSYYLFLRFASLLSFYYGIDDLQFIDNNNSY